MTLGEIKTAVLERVAEISPEHASPVFITDVDARLAINTALRLFAYFTLSIEETGPFTLAPGQLWYRASTQLPALLAPLYVLNAPSPDPATYAVIRPASMGDLDAKDRFWEAAVGRAVARYVPVGFDLMAFYPRLAPAEPGYTPPVNLQISYAAMPPPLVNDTDALPVEIGSEFHPAIADGALPFARLKEGDGELVKTVPYFNRFIEAVREQARRVHQRNAIYDRKPPSLDYFDVSRLWKAKKALLPKLAEEANAGQPQ